MDHAAVDVDGLALVDHYTLNIYTAGSTTVVESVDLGKPVPDADGFIRVDFVALLPQPLTPGVSYEATVATVGPGGTAASDRSDTFGFSLPCSFSLTPSTQSYSSTGGNGSFDVATGATCQWTAVSQAAWLTVTTGASGTGPGTVAYTVEPNTGSASRSGIVSAGGWNFTVVEAAQAPVCTFAVSPTSQSVSTAATSVSFAVSTAVDCAWTATSPVSWAIVASGATGSGPGSVTLTVARNNGAPRSATLTIAGQGVALTQEGKRHR